MSTAVGAWKSGLRTSARIIRGKFPAKRSEAHLVGGRSVMKRMVWEWELKLKCPSLMWYSG